MDITLFADDNYALVWNKCTEALHSEMQTKLELIINWLRSSGLKVNEEMTEVCLFHRRDQPHLSITFSNKDLISKDPLNVLGVAFDSKLNWQKQIQLAITKLSKSLHVIKLISKHLMRIN